MIYRKPTVIQIKAEEDMQDIQPANRQTSQIPPTNPLRSRLQDIRQEIERGSPGRSPYNSELFNTLLSNIRDEIPDDL